MQSMQRLPLERLNTDGGKQIVEGVFQAALFLPADEATCVLEGLVELLNKSKPGALHAYHLFAICIGKCYVQTLLAKH